MKQNYLKLVSGVALVGLLMFTACHPSRQVGQYEVTNVKGSMIAIDSTWDANPDSSAIALLKPYKDSIDHVMYEVIGTSDQTMDKGQPESLLSNLVADVLRLSTKQVLGKPADVGLMNMGGLRSILPKGKITVNAVYEILPFENSLCVITLKGKYLNQLLDSVAKLHGEGVSGIRMEITNEGKRMGTTVDGKPIVDDQNYTVATIDYLADGNGSMTALLQNEGRICPDGATLRGLFLDYVRKQTADGKVVTSKKDGRITIIEEGKVSNK